MHTTNVNTGCHEKTGSWANTTLVRKGAAPLKGSVTEARSLCSGENYSETISRKLAEVISKFVNKSTISTGLQSYFQERVHTADRIHIASTL